MAYESPITLIPTQIEKCVKEINEKTNDAIYRAVVSVLPQVNKDELIKALVYDREQYFKGYHDRDAEIVRCKDCEHRPIKEDADGEDYGFNIIEPTYGDERCPCLVEDGWYSWMPKDDFYCGYGERKGER